uniref:Uncharacterized protein n=1 Tax=Arundo donax TaxID=35708 RepID=A0A0A9SZ13_ARUDO
MSSSPAGGKKNITDFPISRNAGLDACLPGLSIGAVCHTKFS